MRRSPGVDDFVTEGGSSEWGGWVAERERKEKRVFSHSIKHNMFQILTLKVGSNQPSGRVESLTSEKRRCGRLPLIGVQADVDGAGVHSRKEQ